MIGEPVKQPCRWVVGRVGRRFRETTRYYLLLVPSEIPNQEQSHTDTLPVGHGSVISHMAPPTRSAFCLLSCLESSLHDRSHAACCFERRVGWVDR